MNGRLPPLMETGIEAGRAYSELARQIRSLGPVGELTAGTMAAVEALPAESAAKLLAVLLSGVMLAQAGVDTEPLMSAYMAALKAFTAYGAEHAKLRTRG